MWDIDAMVLKIKRMLRMINRKKYKEQKQELNLKKFKLGIAYNVFDGEELLEASIKSVRPEAEYITVVYQLTSNFGQSASENLMPLLIDLKNRQLVDEIYFYEAKDVDKDASYHERQKRDIGLELAKNAGCNYFLSMDTDEFYEAKEIKNAKKYIYEESVECSAVPVVEYIKEPIYMIINGHTWSFGKNEERYALYAPFIMKINENHAQSHGGYFPCMVDTNRSLNGNKKFYLFAKHDIVMHHMSTIRRNLKFKYENSNLRSIKSLEHIEYIQNLQYDILNFEFENNKINVAHNEFAYFRNLFIKKLIISLGYTLTKYAIYAAQYPNDDSF